MRRKCCIDEGCDDSTGVDVGVVDRKGFQQNRRSLEMLSGKLDLGPETCQGLGGYGEDAYGRMKGVEEYIRWARIGE